MFSLAYLLLVLQAKTIESYLGKGYTVLASYGHVRDLLPKVQCLSYRKSVKVVVSVVLSVIISIVTVRFVKYNVWSRRWKTSHI